MGQILSHSEVEAILSSLDFKTHGMTNSASSATVAPTDDISLYDFEHPQPLRSSQLELLQRTAASITDSLQSSLASVLHSSVTVNFLGVEQSTYRDYLATAEKPSCLAILESDGAGCIWLLDMSRALAFTIIDRMLGGQVSPNQTNVVLERDFTEVEGRLIERAVRVVLPSVCDAWLLQNSLQMTRLVSDANLLTQVTSNEAVALVSLEILCGPTPGLMQLCIPWKQAIRQLPVIANLDSGSRHRLRIGAIQIPVTATARIARLTLSARELSSLNPGDVLLTDSLASTDISLDVDGQEIFHGTPGLSHDHKVIRLTNPVGANLRRNPDRL